MRQPAASPSGRRLEVLLSVRGPSATTNPYVVQLARSAPPGVSVSFMTWRRALLGRYDVLHVHWPEVLVRRAGRPARALARLRTAVLLARLATTRTPVVRTLHNVGAHERGDGVERLLLAGLDRLTTHWVRLTPLTPVPRGAAPERAVVVPHGHYRDWYAGHDVPPAEPGRVLHFGILRPYKGVEQLLDAFSRVDDAEARLVVVGRADDAGVGAEVQRRAAADPRVRVRLQHVDDAELAREVGAASLVVLPYRQLHNSGALLLALSLGRPVLVPRTPTTVELAAEVGEGWVLLHDGDVGPQDLARGLAAAVAGRGGPGPDLSARDWRAAGLAHAEVYREALRRR